MHVQTAHVDQYQASHVHAHIVLSDQIVCAHNKNERTSVPSRHTEHENECSNIFQFSIGPSHTNNKSHAMRGVTGYMKHSSAKHKNRMIHQSSTTTVIAAFIHSIHIASNDNGRFQAHYDTPDSSKKKRTSIHLGGVRNRGVFTRSCAFFPASFGGLPTGLA